MTNALISVIVPAYNIAPDIGRCLESLLAQEHRELEIIVVNDGSTDKTGEIIDGYARRDPRIIPLHKENGGVSSARLAGLSVASGTYIGFVDGDDYIEPDMYRVLLRNAQENHADISHCGYQMVFPTRVDYYYNTGKRVIQDRQTGLKDLLSGSFVEPGLWNKLYHRSLFANLPQGAQFPQQIKINEDLLMNYWLFQAADTSVYEDFCPYHYILRKGSASTSKLNEHKLKDPVSVMRIILEDSKKMPEVFAVAQQRYITQLIGIATLPMADQKELIEPFRREIRQELRKRLRGVLTQSRISTSVKLRALWAAVWPASYQWVHHCYTLVTGLDRKYRIE